MSSAAAVAERKPPDPPDTPSETGARLGWLDALRGIAALAVVFAHMGQLVLQRVHDAISNWVDAGQYGVFVFFLVSGYIIPASLERKGSVRGFWVSRAFRLYPMYLAVIALSIVVWRVGLGPAQGENEHPISVALSQLLMLSNLLGGPNVPNVTWTLSYEMVFYLLLTALFVYRVHRHSAGLASVCAVGAVALGGILPLSAAVQGALGGQITEVIVDFLIIGGVLMAAGGRGIVRVAGTTVAAGTGLTLITFNQVYPYPWSGLTILALMFTGTMLYRVEHGQLDRRRAIPVVATVFALIIAAGVWHNWIYTGWQWRIQWSLSILLAGVTFTVGMVLRRRAVPPALAWLGLVSYSIYLLHAPLLNAYRSIPWLRADHRFAIQIVLAAGFLALLLACSALTYRLVEAPMQRLGRRVARALDARFGSDRMTRDVTTATPRPERA